MGKTHASSRGRTAMHVLVVEDDTRLAEALARILEDNG